MTRGEDAAVRRCDVAGCGRRHFGRGYCRTHHERWRQHSDPQADVPITTRERGGVSFWSVVQRLRAERGPASGRRCACCAAPAACWSYDGSDPDERTDPAKGYRYSLDLDCYQPRCRSCARRARRPAQAVAVDVERAARLYRAGASIGGIAALLGASRTAVHTALREHGVPLRRPGPRTPATENTPQELP